MNSTPLLNDFSENFMKINEENIQYKKNFIALLSMGYEKRLLDALYSFYIINSIEQAIQYLMVDNGEWQHNYIESDGVCIICLEESDHIDYKSKKGNLIKERMLRDKEDLLDKMSRISRNSFIKKTSSVIPDNNFGSPSFKRNSLIYINVDLKEEDIKIKKDNLNYCEICYEQFSNDQFYKNSCNHNFCLNCWRDYIETLINDGKIILNCMEKGCEILLEDNQILELVGNNFLTKLKKNKINKLVTTSKNMKFCPIVNCSGYAERQNESDKNVICNNNENHKFCFNCLMDWHDKKSCSEVIDQEFLKWKAGKTVNRCPKCKFWTEKNEGCNHMTCQNCSFAWCWLCLGKYSNGHYARFGPCEGLQFAVNPVIRSKFERELRIIFLYFKEFSFYFLIFSLIILFGTSILFIWLLKISKCEMNSNWTEALKYMTIFLLGVVFHPFILSLATGLILTSLTLIIIFFPFVLIAYSKYERLI